MKLYELQDQLVKIDDVLEAATDPETQEILESAKEDLLKTIDGKIEDILNYIADCKAKVEQLKKEEDRIAKKRKTLENKADYLKSMLMWFMKRNNQTKAEFGMWNVSVSKTPAKVILDVDEDDLPAWFKKVSYVVDKMAIKDQMVNDKCFVQGIDGMPIQVAHIETGETVRIK